MVMPKGESLDDCVLISISISILILQIIFICKRIFSKTIRAHKLTFTPYWLAIGQMIVQIVYASVILIDPANFQKSGTGLEKQSAVVWEILFLELTCLMCEGIIFTILTVNDLLTALMKFQHKAGPQRVQVLKDEHFSHEKRIFMRYKVLFALQIIVKVANILNAIYKTEKCGAYCYTVNVVNICIAVMIYSLCLVSMCRLLHTMKRLNRYLFE